nr:AraC family transcriptional regulator [Croceibacterium selenioxidans]
MSLKLSSRVPAIGSINRFPMGTGELFSIESAPVEVSYRPSPSKCGPAHLSLMVQSRGSTSISQNDRHCRLAEGDVCMLDEGSGFRLVGEECSAILFLRLPRAAALNRHPQLERQFASTFPAKEIGTRLLADTLLRLLDDIAFLDELQRASMMDAIIQMLGVAVPRSASPMAADWRVRRALNFIELNLGIGGLTAESVAQDQHISRRRLDQIMHKVLGQSIVAALWKRRLERAAADLHDPRMATLSAAQIAFSNGYEDAAHFTRAFKRKYLMTPGQWRLNQVGANVELTGTGPRTLGCDG